MDCVNRLDEHSLHPALCFVYDDFWELAIGHRPLLSDMVGEYLLLPAVWTWNVKPDDQCAFEPHRDFVRETSIENENHLDYLTVWIPLTNLNHASSSISVLPASADPDYDKATQRIDTSNVQNIRSLQVPRGSVLGWSVQLAHWGTKQSRSGKPRMSVGYYIQKSHAECFDSPPLDLSEPYPLLQRLSMIGDQILMYSRDRDSDLLRFANSLKEMGGD